MKSTAISMDKQESIGGPEYVQQCLSGQRLFGDDLDEDGIEKWFADEERGYFNLSQGEAQKRAEYDVLNEVTLFRYARARRYRSCLALGCATGQDIAPIAPLIDQILAIEPTKDFWRDEIAGTPSFYRTPTLRGKIDMADNSIELAIAISALHHIPNVTDVLSELYRVLSPQGLLLLREPIVSMGDWRNQRRGLTANERGIPHRWLFDTLGKIGFEMRRISYCEFAPLTRAWHRVRVLPYHHRATVSLDLAISFATTWNIRYHRTSFFQKLMPSGVAIVCCKVG
jgi:SAM-dependent methyltransferase